MKKELDLKGGRTISKKNLVTKEEILDAVAIGRCGPGAASINTIVFFGEESISNLIKKH